MSHIVPRKGLEPLKVWKSKPQCSTIRFFTHLGILIVVSDTLTLTALKPQTFGCYMRFELTNSRFTVYLLSLLAL